MDSHSDFLTARGVDLQLDRTFTVPSPEKKRQASSLLKLIISIILLSLSSLAVNAAEWAKSTLNGQFTEMVLVPDGKILVLAEFNSTISGAASRLAKLNSDGYLDDTFDSVNLGVRWDRGFKSLAVNLDGSILLGGSELLPAFKAHLLRITAEGHPDPAFVTSVPWYVVNSIHKIWVDGHGRITLLGKFAKSSPDDRSNFYSDSYLLEDGSPNPFSALPWPTREVIASNLVSPIAVRHDGSILATTILNGRTHLYMMTPNHLPDPTFETNVFSGPIRGVLFDSTDRILVWGRIDNPDKHGERIFRLTAEGKFDNSFVEIRRKPNHALQLSSGMYLIDHFVINDDGSTHMELVEHSLGRKWLEMPDQTILVAEGNTIHRIDAPLTTTRSILSVPFSTVSAGETNRSVRIPLQTFGNLHQERTLSYELRDGTYAFSVGLPRSDVLVFAPGTSFAYLEIPLNAVNDVAEENRTFTVELLGTDTMEVPPKRSIITVTIYDDDTGLMATFYQSNAAAWWWDQTPVPLDFARKAFSKRIGQVNHVWVDSAFGGPGLTNRSGFYSIHFQGMLVPENSGTYTFQARGNDGVRLWVNNELINNAWEAYPYLESKGQIYLEAGIPVPITLHYYQRDWGAMCALSWIPPGGSEEIVPQRALRPVPLPVSPISLQNFRLNEDGSTTVSLLGTPGAVYNAEVSTNLTSPSWQFLQNIIPTNGTTVQLYTPSTNQHLWLRAVQH